MLFLQSTLSHERVTLSMYCDVHPTAQAHATDNYILFVEFDENIILVVMWALNGCLCALVTL